MKLTQLTITPDIAVRLLSHNHGNRKLRKSHLSYWCDALVGGAVTTTHQGIAIEGTIDDPLRLLDGQHRLAAIVQTGIPMQTILAENVPGSAFENIDGGMSRSMGDRTGLPKHLVSAANRLYYMTLSDNVKPSAHLTMQIADLIEPYERHVTTTSLRGLSPAGIRCGFIAQQKTQGFNLCSEFIAGEFDRLTPALQYLYRRQLTNPIGGARCSGSAAAAQFYALIRALNDPKLTILRMPDDYVARARAEVARIFPEVMDAINKHKATKTP